MLQAAASGTAGQSSGPQGRSQVNLSAIVLCSHGVRRNFSRGPREGGLMQWGKRAHKTSPCRETAWLLLQMKRLRLNCACFIKGLDEELLMR